MTFEQSAAPNASERRRHKRYFCPLPIEITSPALRFPVRGETSDVSLSGCYVNTLMPLSRDLIIDVRISLNGTTISSAACVRTCDHGVGNGIEFREPSPAFLETLHAKLQAIENAGQQSKAG